MYCGNFIIYFREGCIWAGQDINGAFGSNYMHGSFWVMDFELDQECSWLSYSRVMCECVTMNS